MVDLKYTLQIIKEIVLENQDNSAIVKACKMANEDIKEQLSIRSNQKDTIERSREFILYRARTILTLCRDARVFSTKQSEENDEAIGDYSLLIDIVNNKIVEEQLRLESEEGKGERK